MSKLKHIFRSFVYFKRQHLALLLGTVITTAVLTGALIIGDSVKYSLSQMVESRLGKIEYILQTNDRFVSAKLADGISDKLHIKSAAVVMLAGVSTNPENENTINKTQVVGIDSNFWLISAKKMPELNDDEAIISSTTAEKLQLKVNDDLVLKVEQLSIIPLHSPFSMQEVPSVSFRLKVKAIADNSNLGRFSLKSNQVAPYTIFISREVLSKKMEIKGLANLILIANNPTSAIDSKLLNNTISEIWQLKDAGIEINKVDNAGNYEITSDRIFIDKQISAAILSQKSNAQTILTYLVNAIRFGEKTTPYSFITAVSENYLGEKLKNNEIVINQWLADDLNAKTGDSLTLSYFVIDSLRNLKEDSCRFVIKTIISTQNPLINRSLMPKFPGFAKAVNCMEWNTNLPINLGKIRDKDETYWNQYKGTPKAIISKVAGNKIWKNNFGDFTAIRFKDTAVCGIKSIGNSPDQQILKMIEPNDINLRFTEVKQQGLLAAKSGVNFGELFLSLSFFVILAGLMLTVMLYVLSLEARKSEIGLLMSMGFTRKQIMNLRIYENTFTVLMGSILGVLCGILYNYGLLAAINSVWNDIVRAPMMDVAILPMTLLTGALSGFEISMLSIYVITYFHLKKTVVGLINNHSQSYQKQKMKYKSLIQILMIICFAASFGLILFSILTSVDYNAGLFLLSGGLYMIACWLFFNKMMRRRNKKDATKYGLTALAFKNASRNSNRSLSIVVLLSLGVFVVTITAANRKTFKDVENKNQSGTGGYKFWVETTIAVSNDLNTAQGKEKQGLGHDSLLKNVEFAQFLSLKGDDASCLNLNHVEKPEIIGVNPGVFDQRKSFSFETLKSNVDKLHPWLELNKSYADNVIPAYADQTVISWGILKKIGDTLTYVNEKGKKLYLILAGGLNASVFQGKILIADQHFKENFPSVSASTLMLVDAAEEKLKAVDERLSSCFQDYGIEISKTNERLRQFNTVTNTYLSVFMILGGLGLIIASIGIGIILYRNLIDRKQEIALLMALGFPKSRIFRLIFVENLFLIIIGIIVGLASALIGILPSLISINFQMPDTNFVFLLLFIIFANAILWIYLPIQKTLKGNIINSLRNE